MMAINTVVGFCVRQCTCVRVGCGGNTYNCRGSLGYMMWEKNVVG